MEFGTAASLVASAIWTVLVGLYWSEVVSTGSKKGIFMLLLSMTVATSFGAVVIHDLQRQETCIEQQEETK